MHFVAGFDIDSYFDSNVAGAVFVVDIGDDSWLEESVVVEYEHVES